ncbi:MIP/aquaporin family protein [Microvirga sp. 2YAF29]|uniref:MIP/aquaporin family protein n=1 Tax=Microvirga sp. 2YAF29 TaxID=3233031 RepID=UPI003F986810
MRHKGPRWSSWPDRPLHGAPFPPGRLHPKLYLAEFAGTALLVAIGVSCVIAIFTQGSPFQSLLPSEAARRFLAGGLFGLVGSLITVSPIGRVSGAHINPAVSLAFWLEGKLVWQDAVLFMLSQIGGGILGALCLLAWGQTGRSMAFGATEPGDEVPVWGALAGEAAITFILILTIFVTAAHVRTRRFTPWTMPFLFSTMAWCEGPVSGASANPARSIGPALIAGTWNEQWIYVFGPMLGSALAIGFIRLQIVRLPRVMVARLSHFHLA